MKSYLKPYVNNKGEDQPVHLHSLISTFVVRCLNSMICIPAISKIPEDMFSRDVAHMFIKKLADYLSSKKLNLYVLSIILPPLSFNPTSEV